MTDADLKDARGSVAVAGDPAQDDEPADRVAQAVLAVRDVARLGGQGPFGVATYLPGRQVSGVALRDDEVVVHLVVRYGGRSLPEVADDVRAATVRVLADGRPVSVVVEDVEVVDDDSSEPADATPADADGPVRQTRFRAADLAPLSGGRGVRVAGDDGPGTTPRARAPRRRGGASPAPDVGA